MKTQKTISGVEIKVISRNKSERKFTIKKNGTKYRTHKLSKEEFDECENYTANDWENFLKTSGNYYIAE